MDDDNTEEEYYQMELANKLRATKRNLYQNLIYYMEGATQLLEPNVSHKIQL